MAGSTAPGASIYNVYGPDFSNTVYLYGAFSYILNPTNTPGLSQVSVISNSWGGQDGNDSVWFNNLQEATSRGISVLASSGDGGNNPSSQEWCGSDTCFPASMSYSSFGMTAVGGTTVTLNPDSSSPAYRHILEQSAWYISSGDTADGGPAGSEGGLSLIYPEPSWQLTTSANAVIQGGGRGVPDLGALANNTLVTITIAGYQYRATYALYGGGHFEFDWGTSVAAPLEAGIVDEIDHVLESQSNPGLGFLNPQLYALASEQTASLVNNTDSQGYGTGYSCTGPGTPPNCPYASALPTLALLDVYQGANYYYAATRGYDLVTGWGSIDAYNYTMYFLSVASTGVNGRLSGVEDSLSLSGLAVTSS
ncbi:MAG: S8 family serine peptidase, partial [Thermoplasmata archaeon]